MTTAAGVSFYGRSRGMLPQEIFKYGVSKIAFQPSESSFKENKIRLNIIRITKSDSMVTLLTVLILNILNQVLTKFWGGHPPSSGTSLS